MMLNSCKQQKAPPAASEFPFRFYVMPKMGNDAACFPYNVYLYR